MIQRAQIEQILRLNGVPISAPDEEIKSVLLSARWEEDDIEAAVMVLRENVSNHKTHIDTFHKVFHTDESLSPEGISSLLGIEMNITPRYLRSRKRNAQARLHFNGILVVTISSSLLSLIFVFAAMWYLKMGLFHEVF